MATVKLNAGGKVLTKQGKVSCTCCGGEVCCMYPAHALADGFYTSADLPDTIVLKDFGIYGDFILYRGVWSANPAFMGPIGSAGAYWGRSEPEFDEVIIYYQENYSETEGWATGQGVDDIDLCLFSDNLDFVKDQFADTYTVSANLYFPQTAAGINGEFQIERISLCRWRNNDFPDANINFTLDYISQIEPKDSMWRLEIDNNDEPAASTIVFKSEPYKSPSGDYPSEYGTVTIS